VLVCFRCDPSGRRGAECIPAHLVAVSAGVRVLDHTRIGPARRKMGLAAYRRVTMPMLRSRGSDVLMPNLEAGKRCVGWLF
jgi:hypothetical protein